MKFALLAFALASVCSAIPCEIPEKYVKAVCEGTEDPEILFKHILSQICQTVAPAAMKDEEPCAGGNCPTESTAAQEVSAAAEASAEEIATTEEIPTETESTAIQEISAAPEQSVEEFTTTEEIPEETESTAAQETSAAVEPSAEEIATTEEIQKETESTAAQETSAAPEPSAEEIATTEEIPKETKSTAAQETSAAPEPLAEEIATTEEIPRETESTAVQEISAAPEQSTAKTSMAANGALCSQDDSSCMVSAIGNYVAAAAKPKPNKDIAKIMGALPQAPYQDSKAMGLLTEFFETVLKGCGGGNKCHKKAS